MILDEPVHLPAEAASWQPTACILCYTNCGIEVRLGGDDGRRFERVRGDKAHPASSGYTCQKALRLDYYQNGRHRLTSPLRRCPDGGYEEIGWDTAIAEIAQRLGAVVEEHGGESLFFYGGGGQGNVLGGAHALGLMTALGSHYRSNALAQEKTGEFWVEQQLGLTHTWGDAERAEVCVVLGKNTWQSHGMQRARTVLKAIANDPGRTLIVVDPVRTETADLADHHLALRPGTDAFLYAAMLGILVQEDLVDHAFLAEHTTGADALLPHLRDVPVADYCARAGLDEAAVRAVTRRVATATSVITEEELGLEQIPHSTLNSYLQKLIWILVGSFAKPGGMHAHSSFLPLDRIFDGPQTPERTPVTGVRIPVGLFPCNAIADEILTDHPRRFRAMIVESANPVHSLADSSRMRAAMAALDLVVVIDVAMTETARTAHYVLPAASQYEKWECTLFNFEFPRNFFHLRRPLLDALPGTLPEPEIYARLARAMGLLPDEDLDPLRRALDESGRLGFAAAYFTRYGAGASVDELGIGPLAVHQTLGLRLPDGAASAGVLWAAAHYVAITNGDAVRRAGIDGDGPHLGEALFDAIMSSPSGLVFTADDYDDAWRYVTGPDHRIRVDIPDLFDELDGLASEPARSEGGEFPFVLTAGSRRSFSANTIVRNPDFRKTDREGALRINPADAATLGLADGDPVAVVTKRARVTATAEVSDTMQPGHVILPNGYGLSYPTPDGDGTVTVGVPPNELTASEDRDWLAGTPWHKHVRARLERVETTAH